MSKEQSKGEKYENEMRNALLEKYQSEFEYLKFNSKLSNDHAHLGITQEFDLLGFTEHSNRVVIIELKSGKSGESSFVADFGKKKHLFKIDTNINFFDENNARFSVNFPTGESCEYHFFMENPISDDKEIRQSMVKIFIGRLLIDALKGISELPESFRITTNGWIRAESTPQMLKSFRYFYDEQLTMLETGKQKVFACDGKSPIIDQTFHVIGMFQTILSTENTFFGFKLQDYLNTIANIIAELCPSLENGMANVYDGDKIVTSKPTKLGKCVNKPKLVSVYVKLLLGHVTINPEEIYDIESKDFPKTLKIDRDAPKPCVIQMEQLVQELKRVSLSLPVWLIDHLNSSTSMSMEGIKQALEAVSHESP